MKVSKRSVPLDMLAAEEKGYKFTVSTHHSTIMVQVFKDGKLVHDQAFTLEQFVSLLMRDAKP